MDWVEVDSFYAGKAAVGVVGWPGPGTKVQRAFANKVEAYGSGGEAPIGAG